VVVKPSDRGAATALAIVLTQIIVIAGVTVIAIGGLLITRVHATGVADLAALAAVDGADCSRADDIARANRMQVRTCEWNGGDVTVVVDAPAPPAIQRVAQWWIQRSVTVSAAARAGPG
jgi:secretion/DNA translocation related TadE-like protein